MGQDEPTLRFRAALSSEEQRWRNGPEALNLRLSQRPEVWSTTRKGYGADSREYSSFEHEP
jgi:hypothetical protein